MKPAASPQSAFSATGSAAPPCALSDRQSLSDLKTPMRAVVYVHCRMIAADSPL